MFQPCPSMSWLEATLRAGWVGGVAVVIGGCTVDNKIVKIEGNDAFRQADPVEVDMLIVIDDSGSMERYQEALATRFEGFLSYFTEDIDYRIGVTTSTVVPAEPFGDCTAEDIAAAPQGGVLSGEDWVSRGSASAAERFADNVRVGICGGTYEMGLEAAYLAVTGANPGFRRPGAALSVVFVSDEEDNSPGSTSDYLAAFRASVDAPGRNAFNVSALVIADKAQCTDAQLAGGASVNRRFPDLAYQTGGAIADLCTDDFDEIVSQVSQSSSRLLDTFYLRDRPSAGTLEVGVGLELVPCDAGVWSYQLVDDRPAIVFEPDALPAAGSRITVSYDHGSGDEASFCPETGE